MLIKLKYLDKFAQTMFLEKSTEMAHLKFEPTMARLEVGIEAAILLGEGLKIVQNDIEHLGSYLTFWSMRLDWQTCFAFHSLVKRSPSGSILALQDGHQWQFHSIYRSKFFQQRHRLFLNLDLLLIRFI